VVQSLVMLDNTGTDSSCRYHSNPPADITVTHKIVHRSGDSDTFTFDVNIISD